MRRGDAVQLGILNNAYGVALGGVELLLRDSILQAKPADRGIVKVIQRICRAGAVLDAVGFGDSDNIGGALAAAALVVGFGAIALDGGGALAAGMHTEDGFG